MQHVHDPHIVSAGKGIPIRHSCDLKQWKNAREVFDEDLPDWAAKAVPGAKFPWAPGRCADLVLEVSGTQMVRENLNLSFSPWDSLITFWTSSQSRW